MMAHIPHILGIKATVLGALEVQMYGAHVHSALFC